MIEYIYSFVNNGSIVGRESYMAWLPFYDYGLYLIGLFILMGLSIVFLFKGLFMFSIKLFVASICGNVTTYLFLMALPDLEPFAVTSCWFIFTFLYFIITFRRKFNPKFHNYETKEQYFEHIKLMHPDIWKEYMEKGDNEGF